jgi:fumarylpyruvate hydrolase
MAFDLPSNPSVPIVGTDRLFPVRRIFCVGRNYEAHAKEMGFAADREAPIWFTKSSWSTCLSGAVIPYPAGTENCHFEVEFVVAIGKPAFKISPGEAADIIFGYACGIDLTRRDLQYAARDKGYPWDSGKDFENAAIIGAITACETFGAPGRQRITLRQNDNVRQDATIDELIWSIPELIADLSRLYHLAPGDLLFTGTPAGVGPVSPGDRLEGRIGGLSPLLLSISPPE